MSTWKRIEATEAFQWESGMHDAYYSHYAFDGICEDLTPREFVDNRQRKNWKRRPSVHARINLGWTAAYWLMEMIKDDDIPF